MKPFLGEDFLLDTPTAHDLYHTYAANMPIIDYHCHVDPKEIAEDRRFETITQLWLGGDHYKWRLMRAMGSPEREITGDAGDRDKFRAYARAMTRAIGNPLYHWSHLELRRYFDCDLTLDERNADAIYDACNAMLARDGFSVRGIIARSNVDAIATTDDPADDLRWHEAIRVDATFKTRVVPSFRPDAALHPERPTFVAYIGRLGAANGTPIHTYDDLCAALDAAIARFDAMGCRASDHGLDHVPFSEDTSTAPALFARALSGGGLSEAELEVYQTAMLRFLAERYHARGWAMQLHYGAMRNTNARMFRALGPDTGFDAIGARECGHNTARLLNALDEAGCLPKTILFSLNPNDDAQLVTIAGGFQGEGTLCKVQQGSAWWHNDTQPGMEAQMIGLASRGLLGGFLGMLTDSRSFLSYARHEYFRRILCNIVGNWAEAGACPADMAWLGGLVQDVSYRNARAYFGFDRA